ncbi:Crp/Fnr family transcriptional regulator [Epibacterium sp. Ofav1-8]|nr:Crp/Fnr family transcriptional regulator [Epibacterium sp. Ofav1-8]MCG7625165.1 Crp/Fnr family transcriptional regulator [Epibacterium sp. Ofav1-8]
MRASELLYNQGDESRHFYFVESGLIEVSIIKIDGTEVVLELMGAGTICGEGAAFDKLPRFSRAAATVPSVVIEFATGDLMNAFREDGEFAMTLLEVACLKQRILASRLEHMTYREPASRLMELFERLAEVDPSSEMTVSLTHEQIASMTGTSRVTVTRTLQKLREEGKIGFDGGKLILRREDD